MSDFAHIHGEVYPVAEVDNLLDGCFGGVASVTMAGVHDFIVEGGVGEWAEVTVPLRATQQDDMVGVCLADGGCGSFIQRFQLAVQFFHIAEIGSDRLICQFVAEDNRLVLVIGCNLFPDVAE